MIALSAGQSRHQRTERGSILVGALVLILVLTLLGFALFDIARLEARLTLSNALSLQALEVAETGIERGLHRFYLEWTCGPDSPSAINAVNCATPPVSPDYTTKASTKLPLTTNCPDPVVPDGATGFKLLLADQTLPNGGSYTLCVKDVGLGPKNGQLRARGVVTGVTGQTERIIQVDASVTDAVNEAGDRAAVTMGGSSGSRINGTGLIAGSIVLTGGCDGGGACLAINWGGGGSTGSQQNNYSTLCKNASECGLHTLMQRIPWRYEDGTTLVNTLNATLKVRVGEVALGSNSACIGRKTTGNCSDNNTVGVKPLTGVYMEPQQFTDTKGNCPTRDAYGTANCNVYTQAAGVYNGPTAATLLDSPTLLNGTTYGCYFSRPPFSGCSGANPEYFYSSAWRIDDTSDDAACDLGVGVVPPYTLPGTDWIGKEICTNVLAALKNGKAPSNTISGTTTYFRVLPISGPACQRVNAADLTSCTLRVAAGAAVGDAASGSTTIDWLEANADGVPRRPDGQPLNVYIRATDATKPALATCGTPSTSCPTGNALTYRGQLSILADVGDNTPGITINDSVLPLPTTGQSWCTAGPYLCGYAFPANHFLGFVTTGNITMSLNNNRYVLGTFYAGPRNETALTTGTGQITISGNATIGGTLSGMSLSLSNNPGIYQAPWNLNAIPPTTGPGGGAAVTVVATQWREIRP